MGVLSGKSDEPTYNVWARCEAETTLRQDGTKKYWPQTGWVQTNNDPMSYDQAVKEVSSKNHVVTTEKLHMTYAFHRFGQDPNRVTKGATR